MGCHALLQERGEEVSSYLVLKILKIELHYTIEKYIKSEWATGKRVAVFMTHAFEEKTQVQKHLEAGPGKLATKRLTQCDWGWDCGVSPGAAWGRKTDQLYLWKSKVKMLVAQSCPTPCDPVDCSPPGSSVHGILWARILEWVAILFSRGSSWSRDWTQVSRIAGRSFTVWAGTGTQLVESVRVLFGEEKLISCIYISLYNSFPI